MLSNASPSIKARYGTVPSRTTPPLSTSEHLGHSRQYWRDVILGINDGLISTFLLVAGVAGGGMSASDILLTAIAGSLAGAVSMATGEYVATKSQNEVMQGELVLEREHVSLYPEDELLELSNLLPLIGVPNENDTLVNQLLQHYRQHPESLLKIMTVLEFGIVDDEIRSPIRAGLVSCFLFMAGSLPSLLPFFWADAMKGLFVAATGTAFALFLVGAVKTWATRGSWWTAALENLSIAGLGGFLAYSVGGLFDHLLQSDGK